MPKKLDSSIGKLITSRIIEQNTAILLIILANLNDGSDVLIHLIKI